MSGALDPTNPKYPDVPSLLIERPGTHLISLVLNRPERKNALDRDLVLALGDALWAAQSDPEVRVILLGGSGGAFCSGADLTTIRQAPPEEAPGRIDEFHRMTRGIREGKKPVVAVVSGPAVGFGADLCLACDVRLFGEDAYIEEGFVKIGLMPDGGGTHLLARFTGPRAFDFLALGTRLNAEICLEYGIANRVVPSAELKTVALEYCQKLAAAAPLALSAIKESLVAAEREALERALAREKAGQSALLLSADFAEGVQAFLEKRAPRFSGK
jgi:2-(1,2-epoxy-1,2-dihydrophenyl)acetyl-CoA isomerase